MNKIPLLTIAIPTYNRSAKIKKQVQMLLPQLTSEVQLLIIDNNSDYDINELLGIRCIDNVKIVRNRINVGADANIARLFELCTSQWLWTLSDDDCVLPDAVSTVLGIIGKKKDAVSICLHSSFEFETSTYLEFMEKMKSWVCYSEHFWISLRVYNMYKLSAYVIECYRNISSMISPLVMLLQYLKDNDDLCIATKLPVIQESEKTTSWNRADFIVKSSQLYDIFRGDKNAKDTLFYGVMNLNIRHLCVCYFNRDITRKEGWYILKLLNFRYGYLNSIVSFPLEMMRLYAYLILPYSLVRKLANLIMLKRDE